MHAVRLIMVFDIIVVENGSIYDILWEFSENNVENIDIFEMRIFLFSFNYFFLFLSCFLASFPSLPRGNDGWLFTASLQVIRKLSDNRSKLGHTNL